MQNAKHLNTSLLVPVIGDWMVAGNPFFMKGLRERRTALLNRLRKADESEWETIMAKFAFDYAIREEKVKEYFITLKRAKLLDKGENGNYLVVV